MSHLKILVYVMILNNNYLRKISTDDEFEKIKYVGRNSEARLGRGFQTQTGNVSQTQYFFLSGSLNFELYARSANLKFRGEKTKTLLAMFLTK